MHAGRQKEEASLLPKQQLLVVKTICWDVENTSENKVTYGLGIHSLKRITIELKNDPDMKEKPLESFLTPPETFAYPKILFVFTSVDILIILSDNPK